MDSTKIEWRVCPTFPIYKISEFGVLKNIKTDRIIKPHLDKGRLKHKIKNKNKLKVKTSVHRLVADAFLGKNIENLQVDHIDRDKMNNHYTNLRVVTQKVNLLNTVTAERRIRSINRIIDLYEAGLNPLEIFEQLKKHPY